MGFTAACERYAYGECAWHAHVCLLRHRKILSLPAGGMHMVNARHVHVCLSPIIVCDLPLPVEGMHMNAHGVPVWP
jgi:hypothetical protein